MSRENVEVVRSAFEAWNRDDLEGALTLIHPDAVFKVPDGVFLGIEGEFHGHTGVREYWQANKEPWQYYKSHIERTLEAGDIVVLGVRLEGVGKESGAHVDLPFANVFEVADGLITKLVTYASFGDALEAVGLRE